MISFKGCSPCCCTQEQPVKKRYETTKTQSHCQPCCPDGNTAKDKDLLAASVLLNTVAVVLKMMGLQMKSLQRENFELRQENAELRKQIPASKKIDIAA